MRVQLSSTARLDLLGGVSFYDISGYFRISLCFGPSHSNAYLQFLQSCNFWNVTVGQQRARL